MLKNAMLIFALLTASTAFAADGPVTINGCTSTGVENCLFIDTPQGKYALFVEPPRPDPGRGRDQRERSATIPISAWRGRAIKVETWMYSQQQCPEMKPLIGRRLLRRLAPWPMGWAAIGLTGQFRSGDQGRGARLRTSAAANKEASAWSHDNAAERRWFSRAPFPAIPGWCWCPIASCGRSTCR